MLHLNSVAVCHLRDSPSCRHDVGLCLAVLACQVDIEYRPGEDSGCPLVPCLRMPVLNSAGRFGRIHPDEHEVRCEQMDSSDCRSVEVLRLARVFTGLKGQ